MSDDGMLTDPQSLDNAIVSSDNQGLTLQETIQNAILTATNNGLRTTTITLSGYPGQDVMNARVTLTQNNFQLSQSGAVLTITW